MVIEMVAVVGGGCGKSDRGCSGGRKINDGSNVGRRRSGSSGGSCW